MGLEFTIPVKTRNISNSSQGITRGGMYARSAEKKQQRELTRLVLAGSTRKLVSMMAKGGLRVTLTRIAPSTGLDPDDNLRTALKWIKDGVAKVLGIDDRDPIVKWEYDQRRGRDYAVHVRIEERPNEPR